MDRIVEIIKTALIIVLGVLFMLVMLASCSSVIGYGFRIGLGL